MKVLRSKIFSNKEQKDISTSKKIAAGVGNTAAGLGIGYAVVKTEKKNLLKKLAKQEEVARKGIEECDEFTKRNFGGIKNKIKNAINPRRNEILLKREAELWENGAGKALEEVAKTKEKIKRVDRILEIPGEIVNGLKKGVDKVSKKIAEGANSLQSQRRSAAFMKAGKISRRIIKK